MYSRLSFNTYQPRVLSGSKRAALSEFLRIFFNFFTVIHRSKSTEAYAGVKNQPLLADGCNRESFL